MYLYRRTLPSIAVLHIGSQQESSKTVNDAVVIEENKIAVYTQDRFN